PQAYSYTTANGLPNNRIQAIVQANDGHIWIGTSFGGLSEFDGQRFRNYGARQRLSNRISDLAEDRSGNIWVGTPDKGAMRIAKDGLISYGEEEGITNPEVIQIYESPDGELYAISSKWSINRFDGARFTTVHPNLPKRIIDSSSGRWPIIQSRNGEWWVSTIEGLYRFPKVKHLEDLAHTPPLAVYTKRDGLPDNNINRLFEDSPGDIWISSYNPPGLLTRWDRATATFHVYSQAHGIPPLNWTNVFGEAGGHVWLGLHNEGVARHRQGRFEIFTPSNGVPSGIIQGIYQDRKGGLWIASSGGGAARVSDPDAAKPVFRTYQVEDGLSSNNLRSFVEDIWGRVYIGTAKGVDRLDPSTGRIRHYTRTEGLIASEVTAAFADRNGRLWFGTREGVSILIPAADRPQSRPPVWIRAVSIDGVSQTVSELGETSVSGFELTPQQSGIQIEFASPDSGGAATTRYQYHLEGTGADWSSPADQHFISFAHLSPGRYRFLVRAVTAVGLHSDPPSSVTFTVLPPIWRRWWSLSLITIAIGAAIYGLHRYQMRRVLEIERIRMRIATDLHDDIGLNLSRMVILSEVVKQQIGNEHRETVEHLTQIADSARGLVDSMSDIVWSIDPRRDDLHNLLLRIRQFAAGVFEAQGIRWDLHAEQELEKVKLTPSQRREILLVLKEALNNIARHAYCSIASVTIAIIGNQLIAEVRDNGRGFSGTDGDGNGLKNMRERAARLGGSLSVSSSPGRGTTLRLMVPMKQERMNMRWRSRKRGVR
ncbi:MAG: ATP-binding protein, partial [Acidobacteria bacterium]|nr:ATP-binding protein [Acidobacteriota bacterium]